MYHNTTQEPEVGLFQKQTEKQDRLVFNEILKATKPLGASQINIGAPITSVRRSINSLMRDGFIKRVGKQKGKYGRSEYTYAAWVLSKKDAATIKEDSPTPFQ